MNTNSSGLSIPKHIERIAHAASVLREAEYQATAARQRLDSEMYYAHEYHLGASVTEISKAAGTSRETTYKAIDRHRSTLASTT
jgi:hypothetical protein